MSILGSVTCKMATVLPFGLSTLLLAVLRVILLCGSTLTFQIETCTGVLGRVSHLYEGNHASLLYQ